MYRQQVILIIVVLGSYFAINAEDARPCTQPSYEHAHSYLLPLKYQQDFSHFEYHNPEAPKGGKMRVPQMGTYDNFNGILEKGRLAAGYGVIGGYVYESLMTNSLDEPVSHYGVIAEGIAKGKNLEWIAFKLRKEARWHDGEPITVDDVVWTFNVFKEHGSVALKTAFIDLVDVFAINDREVCFVRDTNKEINPILPFAIGIHNIYPKHYWADKDISKTTLEPPLGSGPYRAKRWEIGRVIEYERVTDYWAQEIPAMRGRFNFDSIKFDYFADEGVMIEAHKADVFDVREEGVSKNWATQYNFPAVKAGLFKRDLRPLARPEGLWWPIFWNLDKPKLQDIRVREALWLLYDFPWTNRVLFYDFYDIGLSFFQNSPMAHRGLPNAKELELLEPFRDQLPERVFTQPFSHPETTGYGPQRTNIQKAVELFEEAGWKIIDGVMTNLHTEEPFELAFTGVSYYSIRQNLSLVENLNRVGIANVGRAPEVSNWLFRSRTGKFDGNSVRLGPSETPGLQLRNWFGSAAAGQDYGQNWARIRNPVVDFLIEKVVSAQTSEDLYAATRALDRVLLWNFYFIPLGSQPGYRLVHWDKFGEIRNDKLSRVPFIDAWWWDQDKAQRVTDGLVAIEQGDSE
ncbi:MAG: hypothetical protein CMD77_08785 [Gammaproteobacteria bacterium]|nr:hypothetical protein [Gammaproteobacteria bacterium]